jgi:MFS family permease
MLIEMSRSKKVLFYVAAILVGFCGMAEMGVNPALHGFFETYGYGLEGSYVVSAPTIWMAITSFVCAALMTRITKKQLLIVGVAVFAVSSIFATAVNEFWYFAIARSLMGVGEGVTNTVILAYLAQMYLDEKKHASFVGIWNLCYTLFGAVLSIFGGMFAYPDWTKLFVIFWPSVVVLIAVFIFLPELGMEKKPVPIPSSGEFVAKDKEKFGGLFYAFFASFMIFSLMVGFYMYFFSEYVEVTGLGSYDVTGAMMMAYTLAGAAISLVFGKLFIALKKWTAVCCIVLGIISLVLLYFTQGDTTMAYVGSILMGIGFGAYFPYMYVMVVEMAPLSRVDRAIGLITGGYAVCYFLVAYIVNFLRPILSPQEMVCTPQFLFFGLFGIIPLVIELATMPAYKKLKAQQDQAQEQE